MNLLSWHGTVLRADPAGQWFHGVLWPVDDGLEDLDLALPESGLESSMLLDTLVAAPSPVPGQINLSRDGLFLCASPNKTRLDFDRVREGPFERFLPVTPEMLARFRRLLACTVRIGDSSEQEFADTGEDFVLRVGNRNFPLAGAAQAGAEGLVLDGVTLLPGAARPVPARVALRQRTLGLPTAIDAGMFAKGPGKSLALGSSEELAFPPLTLSDADQIWMQHNPWSPEGQSWGRVTTKAAILRTQNAYVLMSRGQEGTVFDRTGLFTDFGHLTHIAVKGDGHLSRSAETVFVDEAALQDAPFLPGPHALFFGGTLTNYFHWLIEGLVPLRIMAPHLPPGTKLLLPERMIAMRHGPGGDLLPDHVGMLADWGFGGMPHAVVDAPVVRVEQIYWLWGGNLDMIAAGNLREARVCALQNVSPATQLRRIYVRRPAGRSVHNAAELESFLAQAGFETVEMRGLSHTAQISLFDSATFVIGPHGAELSNLLFCRPGTRVIELSPAAQFRPFFAQISDKIGLAHAVLPCATIDGGFDGRMVVDIGRLAVLIEQIVAWNAA
jgi:hypothetical protein